ncbi:MAG: CYTH domain-containing protein [Bacteroidota bacterium]
MEPLRYQDVTLKAQLYELLSVENKLRAMNARFAGVDVQTDTYYEVDRGKLKWRQGTVESLITHYERTEQDGVETTTVFRYDLDPTEEDLYDLRREHRTLGEIHKTRQIFWVGTLKVHLDTLPTGEFFVEIEAIDQCKKVAHATLLEQAHALREQLGISKDDLVPTGYFEGPEE